MIMSKNDYKKITSKFTHDFLEIIKNSKNICITAHLSPDEDSIASVLAMYSFLKSEFKNKNIRILYTGKRVENYDWLLNYKRIEFVKDIDEFIPKFDVLIMLDGSQYHRFTHFPESLDLFKGKKICIDHHSSPIDSFDLSLVVPSLPSCSEIIYLS